MKEKDVKLLSIAELLAYNPETKEPLYKFKVPTYQRGYRWGKQQVKALLDDLYSYALTNSESKDSYYCLQPIVVKACDEEYTWELIDGQQRLTTLSILIQCIIKGDLAYLNEEYQCGLFEIDYEIRQGSTAKIMQNVLDFLNDGYKGKYLDIKYIEQTVTYINEWFKEGRIAIEELYKNNLTPKKCKSVILDLLTLEKHEGGVVKVIWYEIPNKSERSIELFKRMNIDKVPLTSSELIKGLFLRSLNFESSDRDSNQIEIAYQWENIQNVLQDEFFWGFIGKKSIDKYNRIELFLELNYLIDNKTSDSPGKNELFLYYQKKFNERDTSILQQLVVEEWEKIVDLFKMCEGWYNDSETYNLIGYLNTLSKKYSKYKFDLRKLTKIYLKSKKHAEFIEHLKEDISIQLNLNKLVTNNSVEVYYTQKTEIYPMLVLLNVTYMNLQYGKTLGQNDMNFSFKFPFSLLEQSEKNKRTWDIEHIASQTNNGLQNDKERKEWLSTSYDDLRTALEVKDKKLLAEIEKSLESSELEDWDNLYQKVIKFAGDDQLHEDQKDHISNLALLDSGVNRSYGNALFCTKRRIIIEKAKDGLFIPVTTQMAFMKYFDDKGTHRSVWSTKDCEQYNTFIYNTLKEYYNL